ncbi:hypothetical protein [Synechococcus sp. UW140]|uniref:hypothetical protein n=1 Tax=Synechococcus sp. UW140 TaxID=368503 RepID=UPI0025D7425F|nr:hypothetical protein [Synechococcus sp. UW140]
MGRRRTGNTEGINLFSFLNIMAATIGVQTLLIVICALKIKPGVQAIQLLPAGGVGKGKEANYIICNGSGQLEVVGQGSRRVFLLKDPLFDKFLDAVSKNRKPQYVVIGVRPTAYRDFEIVRSKTEARRIAIGYEPLENGLKVKYPPGMPAPIANGSG